MGESYTLHEDPRSGNCFKIALTAALLGLPLERKQYDIMQGETRTPEFLENVNANGRIPVLQIDGVGGTRFLPESNAACFYLADGSNLVPSDRFEKADMLRWMFFEQYNHEPNLATLRFWLYFIGEANLTQAQRDQILAKRIGGEAALKLMDEHLSTREWFVGDGITLADITLYPYTSACEAGGFALRDFKHVCAWLKRVEAQPGYIPMG